MSGGDMGIEGISVSENQDLIWLMVQTRGFSLPIPILPKTIHTSNGVVTIRFWTLLSPRGKTAIMVGEGGNVLRMTLANSSIGRPVAFHLRRHPANFCIMEWDGSWAYIGGGWMDLEVQRHL